MSMKRMLAIVSALLAAACGGGSGGTDQSGRVLVGLDVSPASAGVSVCYTWQIFQESAPGGWEFITAGSPGCSPDLREPTRDLGLCFAGRKFLVQYDITVTNDLTSPPLVQQLTAVAGGTDDDVCVTGHDVQAIATVQVWRPLQAGGVDLGLHLDVLSANYDLEFSCPDGTNGTTCPDYFGASLLGTVWAGGAAAELDVYPIIFNHLFTTDSAFQFDENSSLPGADISLVSLRDLAPLSQTWEMVSHAFRSEYSQYWSHCRDDLCLLQSPWVVRMANDRGAISAEVVRGIGSYLRNDRAAGVLYVDPEDPGTLWAVGREWSSGPADAYRHAFSVTTEPLGVIPAPGGFSVVFGPGSFLDCRVLGADLDCAWR